MLEKLPFFHWLNVFKREREYVFYACVSLLFFWCFYSSFHKPQYYLNINSLNSSRSFLAQAMAILALALVIFSLYRNFLNRTLTFLFASMLLLLIGQLMGFYAITAAFQAIDINAISLLFGISLISIILAETNIFVLLCHKILEKFGNSNYALFVVLCLVTYLMSMFINNLSTMLLILPVTYSITKILKLNIFPYVVGEIIASNLGGASTMFGDFPNMLIASQMHIAFHSFIGNMMPVCILNLVAMLAFFYYKIDFEDEKNEKVVLKLPQIVIKDETTLWLGLIILGAMIILFMFNKVPQGIVALIGAMILYIFSKIEKAELIKKIRYEDLIFFVLLFIFVGGIRASGLITTINATFSFLAGGSSFLQCILLMWLACLVAMFLNAGPSTLLMMPLFIGINGVLPNNMIFWALSLGICAGSSGTLLGGTAGIPSLTFLEKMYKNDKLGNAALSFKSYFSYGFPVAVLHLMISTIYIALLFIFAG